MFYCVKLTIFELVIFSSLKLIEFYLPYPKNNIYDNISCNCQKINFIEKNYSTLIIIGCAEWGNQSTSIIVNYVGENKIKLPFEISDWSFSEPIFNELLIWKGKSFERTKNGIELINWFKGNIFAQLIKLDKSKKLESIVLPDCGNIHVFALTLGE
jgi:hypothetical protein